MLLINIIVMLLLGQEGSKFVWMNDPSIYWEDGSYELEGHDSPDRIGQKIYYPGYNVLSHNICYTLRNISIQLHLGF